jgi:hypothetical protein
MAQETYKITGTQPYVYLDQNGKVIHGYKVNFNIIKFEEIHSIEVPTLDPAGVKTKIDKIVSDRNALG